MTQEEQKAAALSLKDTFRIIVHGTSMKSERRIIRTLLDELFGKNYYLNERCGNCWGDALAKILDHLNLPLGGNKSNTTMATNSQFTLKANKVLMTFGSSDSYTNANLTDKVVIDMLTKMSPAAQERWLKNTFAVVPENWKELAGIGAGEVKSTVGKTDEPVKTNAPAAPKLKELSKEKLQDLAAQLQYPESEWKELNRKDLLSYMTKKVTPTV